MEKKNTNTTFRMGNNLLHENLGDHFVVRCPICNREIQPYWEPRYNGVRATCTICGTNWQES